MPIKKSAQKALRQNIRRKKRNTTKKNRFRMVRKEFKKALSEKDPKKAKETLSALYKALDKMAKTNVFHKNKSSRLKSEFSKKYKKVFIGTNKEK